MTGPFETYCDADPFFSAEQSVQISSLRKDKRLPIEQFAQHSSTSSRLYLREIAVVTSRTSARRDNQTRALGPAQRKRLNLNLAIGKDEPFHERGDRARSNDALSTRTSDFHHVAVLTKLRRIPASRTEGRPDYAAPIERILDHGRADRRR